MNMTTTLRVLSLFFFLSLPKTCLAQDWAKPLESSTPPTDYQAILEKNLTVYNHTTNKVAIKTNMTNYVNNLAQQVQNITASSPKTAPQQMYFFTPVTATVVPVEVSAPEAPVVQHPQPQVIPPIPQASQASH